MLCQGGGGGGGEFLLLKGLNFSIPLEKFTYADYLVKFELFYRYICNLEIHSAEELDFIKTKDIALSSFGTCNNNVPKHLSKGELEGLKYLLQNKNIVIQKSDKGDYILIVHRDKILKRWKNLYSKFQKTTVKDSDFIKTQQLN